MRAVGTEILTIDVGSRGPIVSYLFEKHQTGVLELGRSEIAGVELALEISTHASEYYEVLVQELRRLSLDCCVHRKTSIIRRMRPGEGQIGSSLMVAKGPHDNQTFHYLKDPAMFEETDYIDVTLRLWELPYLIVTSMLDGPQKSFVNWTDHWWLVTQ